jgi:hypothetical protein
MCGRGSGFLVVLLIYEFSAFDSDDFVGGGSDVAGGAQFG